MKSLVPNTLLQNRYLIVHLIGKGGMGDVYLSVDQRLGSAVALKRTFFSDDEMLGNAFEREAKTLARLRHPVLPKVSDHFSENEEQYLVMEHISGDDLSKRLESAQKPFPLSWVLFWADQLLDALAYLHAHEPPIIHRDIKPQNLKLTDENHIILLDFGLSKNSIGETRALSTGSTGSVVGYTPHYAPMEQIRGTGTNPRSDIYALSATLYQLMTNTVPADALTRADALLNDMADPIKPINEVNPEIPKAVSDVILKGIEISQDKRFPAAREMQKALREAYSSMQNAMMAQTVAFNLQPAEQTPAPEKSELGAAPINIPLPEASEIPASTAPTVLDAEAHRQPVDSLSNKTPTREQEFNSTLRMPSASENSSANQSDVKTEVFLAGASPAIVEAQNSVAVARNHEPEESFAPTESFSLTEDFGKESAEANSGGFTPDATVPLFTFEDKNDQAASSAGMHNESAFDSQPRAGSSSDTFATFTPTQNFSTAAAAVSVEDNRQDERADSTRPRPPQPRVQKLPPKKSSGKSLAVFGGLAALLILVLGAAGGGWYYYNNYYRPSVVEKPTPSPAPSFEISPSPEFTPENVFGANTNASDNSNIGLAETNVNAVTKTNTAPVAADTSETTRTTPVPPKGGSTPKPTPTVIIKIEPSRTTPTPASKPVPRPTNNASNRTIILQ